jgi:hypothetical protein
VAEKTRVERRRRPAEGDVGRRVRRWGKVCRRWRRVASDLHLLCRPAISGLGFSCNGFCGDRSVGYGCICTMGFVTRANFFFLTLFKRTFVCEDL